MHKYLFLFTSLLFIACGEDAKTTLVADIDSLTEAMKQEDFPSSENMDSIVGLYDQYITAYPEDEASFDYLELKAKYLAANNKYKDAIQVYDVIINKYQDDARVADAVFMQAFITENYVGDKDAAAERYKTFIAKYPDHELADDAKFSIENLSLTDEQIFEKLLEMQQPDTAMVVVGE